MRNRNLTIAGPGSGKTTSLIDSVISTIGDTSLYRDVAVVTYTNSATNKIRDELKKRVDFPPNLFVGTIHSFFNKYIFLPYANIFNEIAPDPTFIDDIIVSDRSVRKRGIQKNIATKLFTKGVVQHDIAVEATYELLLDANVVKAVSARISDIFVDEYQDAMTIHHKIFDLIYKAGKTNISYIGDPEQYIFSFAYSNGIQIKNNSKPSFNEIPILQINSELNSKGLQVNTIQQNYRSSKTIVDFLNRFNGFTRQNFKSKDDVNYPIYFINEIEADLIFDEFNKLCAQHSIAKGKSRFVLAHEGETLKSLPEKFNLAPIDRFTSINNNNALLHAIDLILSSIGVTRQELLLRKEMDHVDLKILGIKLLKDINKEKDYDIKKLDIFLNSHLSLQADGDVFLNKKIDDLSGYISVPRKKPEGYYSTIHKAKGLEADAVLVIAKTSNELNKWLEENHETRNEGTGNTCREGFVAFSRAKKILCISCVGSTLNLASIASTFNFEVVGSTPIQQSLFH